MESQKHILSKSTFMYGVQCPKRLYLHKFQPELKNTKEEGEQSIFSTGLEVGLVARDLFPNGVSAEPSDSYSYHLSVEKTQQYINEGANIIYEACFLYDGVLCAIDILAKENNKWFAYEVKGSTKVKEEHILDTALQYYVITKSGLHLEDISIVYLNNQYVRLGELEVQNLFNKQSIIDGVKEQQPFIEEKIIELKKVIADRTEPIITVGDHCFKPNDCNFSEYCWTGIEEEKSARRANINQEYLKEFFSGFTYPYFYFDFETIMPAIPEFNNSRPYQQIPFQYSLHIHENEDSELKHVAFLGDGLSDPRLALIKQLIDDVGTKGSIITWNMTFEKSRLKELAKDFPEFETELNGIINRLVDLMIPFRKKEYYHVDFNESYSIKKVLPVLCPELGYEELVIQEGTTASITYTELKNQSNEIQDEQRKHLLEYCKLDTLAMVKILEKMIIHLSKKV